MPTQTTLTNAPARRAAATAALALLGLLAVSGGSAVAGTGGGPPTNTLLAMGSTTDRIVVKTHPHDSSTVRMVRVAFEALQETGWHTHPGPGIVTIQTGTFTLQRAEKDGCAERQLGPGDVFVDDGTPHTLIARSAGVAFVTLVTPTAAGAPTVPFASPPDC